MSLKKNPGGDEILRTRPDRPRGPPSLLYNGYQVFPREYSSWDMNLNTHPHLAPLLTVWAFVVWSRVSFTFTFTLPSERMEIST
jgi:hypothetical protein